MSECERCEDLAHRLRELQGEIEKIREDLVTQYNKTEEAEYQVRKLEPYKKESEKAYDHYVTTPKGMP